jgi:hypothetical protein
MGKSSAALTNAPAKVNESFLSPFSGLVVSRQGIYSLATPALKPVFSLLTCKTA